MPDQVDTRVSPVLHPAWFDNIEGLDERTAPCIAEAVSVFRDAYVTAGKIHDATEAAKRNPAWTPENRVLMVGKVAQKEQQRLLRKMDLAMDTLSKGVAHIEGELTRPVRERAGQGNLNQEVRAHCKGLSAGDRARLLHEALEGGDNATVEAIIGAQPFLSGMSREEQALYTHRYNEKQNPHLVTRLKVMRAALDKVERDGGRVIDELHKAVGAPPAKLNAINAANERALAALSFPPAA